MTKNFCMLLLSSGNVWLVSLMFMWQCELWLPAPRCVFLSLVTLKLTLVHVTETGVTASSIQWLCAAWVAHVVSHTHLHTLWLMQKCAGGAWGNNNNNNKLFCLHSSFPVLLINDSESIWSLKSKSQQRRTNKVFIWRLWLALNLNIGYLFPTQATTTGFFPLKGQLQNFGKYVLVCCNLMRWRGYHRLTEILYASMQCFNI